MILPHRVSLWKSILTSLAISACPLMFIDLWAEVRASSGSDPILDLMRPTEFNLNLSIQQSDSSSVCQIGGSTSSPQDLSTSFVHYDGIGFAEIERLGSLSVPPDPVGDVGRNHYIQMVNGGFAIYDKSMQRL